jgi:hypothetical protein
MASDNDRAAIRQAYLDYLGRDASEADVEGWATGQFGGGGLNDWLNQIQNSDEGQAYAARSQAPNADPPDYRPPNEVPNSVRWPDKGYYANTEAIREAYREYLGREGTEAEVAAYMDNGQDHSFNMADIHNSGEAVRYRMRPPEGTSTATPPDTPAEPTGRTGQAPGGYDQTKWESGHDSMKYAVGGFLAGLTKPSEIKAMVESAAFQDRFGGATFDGKDKINFNGIESDGV